MDIYIIIDLMEGFSKDTTALKYIYENMEPMAPLPPKVASLKKQKVREFTNTKGLCTGFPHLRNGDLFHKGYKTQCSGIMPGIMPKIIKKIHEETGMPVIGGGLISDKEDVIEIMKAGALGIPQAKKKFGIYKRYSLYIEDGSFRWIANEWFFVGTFLWELEFLED